MGRKNMKQENNLLNAKSVAIKAATATAAIVALGASSFAFAQNATETAPVKKATKKSAAKNASAKEKAAAGLPSKKPASVNTDSTATTNANTTTAAAVAPAMKINNQSISEYAFAPLAGQKYLTVTPTFSKRSESVKVKGEAKASNSDHNLNLIGLIYGFALNDSMNATVGTKLGTDTIESSGQKDRKESGFTDIELKLTKIQNKMGNSQLYYGAHAFLSPADKENGYDYGNGNSSTGNLFSGGHSFGPFAGYQIDNVTNVVGVKGEFLFQMEKKRNENKASMTQTGGHRLVGEVYTEALRNKVTLGAKAGLTLVQPTDYEFNNSGAKTKWDSGAYQVLNLGGYGKINVNQKLEIIPAIGLTKVLNSSGGSASIEQDDEFAANLTARIAL